MAIDLGVMIHWEPARFTAAELRPMITWIGPVILMTAAMCRSSRGRCCSRGAWRRPWIRWVMLIGRAAAAYRFDSALDPLVMHYPNYLLLGVAVVVSGVVTKLGQQVTRAREMGELPPGRPARRGGMGEVYLAITACSPVRPRSS